VSFDSTFFYVDHLELERRLQTAVKCQNYNDQSEIQLELAELLKESDSDSAIDYYESALKSSKRAHHHRNTILAYRNLGELHINLAETEGNKLVIAKLHYFFSEDYRRAFKYLKQQLEHAEEVKDYGLVQLAFHTLSQSYAAEAQSFGHESINMTKVCSLYV
jgi:tetratricopeptide (TPR) repeat protein